jgi:hypothetical protein
MGARAVASAATTAPVAPGVVKVEPLGGGWWHVAIGRDRTTKRFNLSRGEAAELVRVLRAEVLTSDGGGA